MAKSKAKSKKQKAKNKGRKTTSQGKSKMRDDLKPRLLAFELTRRCRYQCKHCRANAGPEGNSELSTKQCEKIIASIVKFAKPMLILTGGEPMERQDLYEIIKYAREKGLRVVMATCGYLLNDESIVKLKKAGVSALSFSIDGSSAETHDRFRDSPGAFDTVMRAAEVARRAKMPFQINTTICKLNAGEIIGIAELAKRLGATCFNPFIMVPTGRAKEIDDAILDPVEYETILGELVRIKLRGEIKVRVTCGPAWARICTGENEGADGRGGRLYGGQRVRIYKLERRRADVRISGYIAGEPGQQEIRLRQNLAQIEIPQRD